MRNVNYTAQAMTEIYRQAQSGGVLLSAMGNPAPLPVYWDKLLINASQVTNPSIDPLREPMETRVYLGSRPEGIRRDKDGKLIDDTPPQLKLEVPIMFSAMSYGSISYNAHESLARAAEKLDQLSAFRLWSDGAFGKPRACRSPVRTITDGTGNHFLVLLPTIDA